MAVEPPETGSVISRGLEMKEGDEADDPRSSTPSLDEKRRRLGLGFWLGVAALVLIVVVGVALNGGSLSRPAGAAATFGLVVCWWVAEAVPLGVTGLVPAAVMPILGAVDGEVIADAYFSDTIMLFFGSVIVAKGIERHGLHERLARSLLRYLEHTDAGILFGVLLVTAFASAWMSNTTTASMMAPLAMATTRTKPHLREPAALAVCFGSCVGGMATLTGTGTNLAYQQVTGATFAAFAAKAAPISIACNGLLWLLLCWHFRIWRRRPQNHVDNTKIDLLVDHPVDVAAEVLEPEESPQERRRRRKSQDDDDQRYVQKKWTRGEIVVAVDATAMALLWITRDSNAFGGGWSHWMPTGRRFATDGTVAICAAVVLLVWPDVLPFEETLAAFPWNTFFLLGGGVALATGVDDAGFDTWVATNLIDKVQHQYQIVAAILIAVALSNVVSNVAAANVLLPLLKASRNNDHRTLFLVALACSMAFLFPISTPPNAIVLGHCSDLSTHSMLAVGAKFTLICLAVLAFVAFVLFD